MRTWPLIFLLCIPFGCDDEATDDGADASVRRTGCALDEEQSCQCPRRSTGVQLCDERGRFGPCQCPGEGDADVVEDGEVPPDAGPDAAADASEPTDGALPIDCEGDPREACGQNGRGSRSRFCEDGEWGEFGDCEDPDECTDEAVESEACGQNGEGRRRRTCETGEWSFWGECEDDDTCVNGASEQQACGINGRGAELRTCADGSWSAFGACEDPDECADGATEEEECVGGLRLRGCVEGRWGDFSACDDQPDRCDVADPACARCTDELEPNDGLSSAGLVEHGYAAGDLTVCSALDAADWFRFEVVRDSMVEALVNSPQGVRIEVTDSERRVIGEGEAGGSAYLHRAFVERGTWYLRVGTDADEASYDIDLQVTRLPACSAGDRGGDDCVQCNDGYNGNSNAASAELLLHGVTVSDVAVCADGPSEDWFFMDLPDGGFARVEVQLEFGVGPFEIDIVDAEGVPIPDQLRSDPPGGTAVRDVGMAPGSRAYFRFRNRFGATQYSFTAGIR